MTLSGPTLSAPRTYTAIAASTPNAFLPGTSRRRRRVRLALEAACSACDAKGMVLDDDDDKPMRRCAHSGVTVGTGAAR
ncbi:hypothetical protein ACF1GT_29195 [Streptomyces sp. NPDC014636]|uniref:hypothetical protein n=1 Tax=Streptomyces sp. NPDC014636 TaxID=3364876 RepID=UPI0036FBD332